MPISNLIDNLHFVKSLREKEIINSLNFTIVYQEKNFREIPQFVKRCLEEFAADHIRLRPVSVWGEDDMNCWFRDVRNEYHPHYKEFLEVMKDPILKDPRVQDGGGGKPSGLGPEPYVRLRAKYRLLENIFCNESFEKEIEKEIETKQATVYGMTAVGKALASRLKERYEIPFLMDRAMNGEKYAGIPIFAVNHLKGLDRNVTVIVSLDTNEDAVVELLKREGFQKVISINELVRNCNEAPKL